MGHYRAVHDPERLADETLVGDHPAPALEGTDFVCSYHRLGYILALICVKGAPAWLPMEDVIGHLPAGDKGIPTRFLWYHAAEIAGFTLIPFLIWHHYFDDLAPQADKDAWGAFWFRSVGVLILCVVNYIFFYYINFGHWAWVITHMTGGIGAGGGGESLNLELLVDHSATLERMVFS